MESGLARSEDALYTLKIGARGVLVHCRSRKRESGPVVYEA